MMNNDATRFLNLLGASSTPMTLWWQTCLKAAETMVAVPQVITHRTARMARAGSIPTQVDQRECAAMGAEKVVAFSQAWMNAASEIVTFQQQMANTALRPWWAMANLFNPVTAFTAPWSLMKAPIDLLSAKQPGDGDYASSGPRGGETDPRQDNEQREAANTHETLTACCLRSGFLSSFFVVQQPLQLIGAWLAPRARRPKLPGEQKSATGYVQ